MDKILNFGIVGCGTAAAYHAQSIIDCEGANLAAACGSSRDKGERFCTGFGIDYYESLEQMLGCQDLDAIAICTPSGLHYSQAAQVLSTGKHVVIEKPICITDEDADRLYAQAKASDKTVCVISQFRFTPAAQEIRRAMDSGAFGRLVSASLSMRYFRLQEYYDSGAWRGTLEMDGGGVLMNQGIHGVDLLTYLMGPVKSLTAYTRTRLRDIPVEDTACAILDFENGAVGVIDATVCNKGGAPMRIEICGERGSVILEDEVIKLWSLDTPCNLEIGGQSESSSGASPTGISTRNHTRQYQAFVDAVRQGTVPQVTVREAKHALQIVCGVYRSQKLGREVQLDY